jgi:hypothetical protein
MIWFGFAIMNEDKIAFAITNNDIQEKLTIYTNNIPQKMYIIPNTTEPSIETTTETETLTPAQ